jgi:hypothetical protein
LFSFQFLSLGRGAAWQPVSPMLLSNREAAMRKQAVTFMLASMSLLYVGIELPEPLSLTEVTDR